MESKLLPFTLISLIQILLRSWSLRETQFFLVVCVSNFWY